MAGRGAPLAVAQRSQDQTCANHQDWVFFFIADLEAAGIEEGEEERTGMSRGRSADMDGSNYNFSLAW